MSELNTKTSQIKMKLSLLKERIVRMAKRNVNMYAFIPELDSVILSFKNGQLEPAQAKLEQIKSVMHQRFSLYTSNVLISSLISEIEALNRSLVSQKTRPSDSPPPQNPVKPVKREVSVSSWEPTPNPSPDPSRPSASWDVPISERSSDSFNTEEDALPAEETLGFFPPAFYVTVTMGNNDVFHGQWYKESKGFLLLILDQDAGAYKKSQLVYLNIRNIQSLG